MLELVGLDAAAARKRVGQYSLGMRQRLGIAHALLGDPEVLILDEPANGLDPEGMRWMRGLLRDFADRGGTVLLSSHLLHEVQVIADRLVIIAGGRIVAQGTPGELLGGTPRTRVRSADDHRALVPRTAPTSDPSRSTSDRRAGRRRVRRGRRRRRAGRRRRPARARDPPATAWSSCSSSSNGARDDRDSDARRTKPSSHRYDPSGGPPMSALASARLRAPSRRASARLRPADARRAAQDARYPLRTLAPAAVAAVTLITVIITALVKGGHDATLARPFNHSVEPAAILLPVLGVLLVCGEWSQRTTLTTFTLVPSAARPRRQARASLR